VVILLLHPLVHCCCLGFLLRLVIQGVRERCSCATSYSLVSHCVPSSHCRGTADEDAATQHVTQESNDCARSSLHFVRKTSHPITDHTNLEYSFYQGSEVAISGWVISYLIQYRDGQPSKVGNVTAGFWGGITLGRFIIVPFAERVGLRLTSVCLIIGAAIFQSLVWAVPDIITNAVAESIVGFFLGPIYPLALAVFARLWPRNIQISSLSLVTSMGSSGGALVPFFTGLMAQKLTTVVLHPIALFSFATMMVAWLSLPRVVKRTE
jgi:fucose permease